MSKDEGVHIGDGTCVKETDKAILVESDDIRGGKIWIPKSQVHDDSEVFEDGHEGKIVVTKWFATKEGLT